MKILYVDHSTINKIQIYFNTLAFLSTLYENISDLLRSKKKSDFHVRYDKYMTSYKTTNFLSIMSD